MTFDYNAFYAENPHGLGAATPEVMAAFDGLTRGLTVLDIGCGQGRDALPLARQGFRGHGVDQHAVLSRLLGHVAPAGSLFIADEKSNLPGFREVIARDPGNWQMLKDEGQYLFLRQQPQKEDTG